MEKLYTIEDIVEIFGIHENTARRWASSGAIPAFRLGKRWFVRKEDFRNFIAGKIEQATEA